MPDMTTTGRKFHVKIDRLLLGRSQGPSVRRARSDHCGNSLPLSQISP